jgi:hypothetical protein
MDGAEKAPKSEKRTVTDYWPQLRLCGKMTTRKRRLLKTVRWGRERSNDTVLEHEDVRRLVECFQRQNVVGIDEEGVNADYQSMSETDLQRLLTNPGEYTEYKDRVFREFSKWMQRDDLIIIGTGQTTAFNLAGVARVRGDYFFDVAREPRHLREVEFLAIPQAPRAMQRFARTSRLELIHEADFHEAILSLVG